MSFARNEFATKERGASRESVIAPVKPSSEFTVAVYEIVDPLKEGSRMTFPSLMEILFHVSRSNLPDLLEEDSAKGSGANSSPGFLTMTVVGWF